MINWIKEFPFRTGGVLLLMEDKKGGGYKVVDDIVCYYLYKKEDISKWLEEEIEKDNKKFEILPDGRYKIYTMSRACFKNVLGYIYKEDLIKIYETDNTGRDN